jgi:hypothetical protein
MRARGEGKKSTRTEVGLDGLLERGELAAVSGALLEHRLEGPRDEPARGARHRRGSHELLRPQGGGGGAELLDPRRRTAHGAEGKVGARSGGGVRSENERESLRCGAAVVDGSDLFVSHAHELVPFQACGSQIAWTICQFLFPPHILAVGRGQGRKTGQTGKSGFVKKQPVTPDRATAFFPVAPASSFLTVLNS